MSDLHLCGEMGLNAGTSRVRSTLCVGYLCSVPPVDLHGTAYSCAIGRS